MVANPKSPSAVEFLSSASGAIAVTTSDTTNLTTNGRALYVGTGGTVSVLMADGTTGVFSNVQDGTLLPIHFKRVNTTGTVTAANMVALI